MAQRARKSAGPGGKQRQGRTDEEADTQDEQPLQAVVLADTFEARFRPLTLERPKCLLPLVNTPLIEYTLEFLANAGVDQVYVYCSAHVELIEDYLLKSVWASRSSPFSLLRVLKSTATSVGDAMRDLDKRALLTGDFLLVYGDVIANVSLDDALAAHRARRSRDGDAIMTLLLRPRSSTSTLPTATSPLFVIDPGREGRVLQYEEGPVAGAGKSSKSFVPLESTMLLDKATSSLELRGDLTDCGVDICTPAALALWSDNFDYELPRQGYLHSVLKDYELNGKTVHVHLVGESLRECSYAGRARNLRTYDSISRDIIGRWSYPFCPDTNLLAGQTYRLRKRNVYVEDGVTLARSCLVERNSAVGTGSFVGEGSVVRDSVIGRGCRIGSNVILDGAYIWDGVAVGDGSSVAKALVAADATIGAKCVIQSGAVISFGVKVADGRTVRGESRLTRVGVGKLGARSGAKPSPNENAIDYEASDDEEGELSMIEGLVLPKDFYEQSIEAAADESVSEFDSDEDLEEYDGADAADAKEYLDSRRRMSTGSNDSYPNTAERRGSSSRSDFYQDASASIYDSLVKNDDPANVQLELTALRMSANASEHAVRRAVASAFVRRIVQLLKGDGTAGGAPAATSAKQAVTRTFSRHGSHLIGRVVFDKATAAKPDQVDFLLLVQTALAAQLPREDDSNSTGKPSATASTAATGADAAMLFVANHLYTQDILDTGAFEQWWQDPRSTSTEQLRWARGKMGQFMDVLLADSESEDDEDDDDEEDDEDG